jgi:hypothetical protein
MVDKRSVALTILFPAMPHPRSAIESRRPANSFGPYLHPEQSDAPALELIVLASRIAIESSSVVAYHDFQFIGVLLQTNPDQGCRRMGCKLGQPFLHHAEAGLFH